MLSRQGWIRGCLLLLLAALVACGGGGGAAPAPMPKAWGTAALIETASGGDAESPQIAFDASGNGLAVWSKSDGTRNNIWANRYTAGSGWGSAVLIETDNAGDAYYPQLAYLANGNALAVWEQSDGTRSNIWSNRYTVGTGWGTAELIEISNLGNASEPQLVTDTQGNAHAVWHQFDGTHYNIWANRFSGGGWGAAQLIETDNAGDAFRPHTAIDTNGNVFTVWYQSDGTRRNIMANRYTNGTGWGTAQLIETDNAGEASNTQVATDSQGNAIAVWSQTDGTRYNIWANRYIAGTGWGTAQLIETDNLGHAYQPQIAFDAGGNALAVWHQVDGVRPNIWANRYTAGTGWGTAQLIETDNTGAAYDPQLAVEASGNAWAVWKQFDGTRYNIWVNRYAVGTGWGTAQLIETNAGDAWLAEIAIDASGHAMAVWCQSDGTRYNLWANRYQ